MTLINQNMNARYSSRTRVLWALINLLLNTHRVSFSYMLRILVFTGILFLSVGHSLAQVLPQRLVNINTNWEYLEDESLGLDEIRSRQDWERIALPHTWNALDPTDLIPGYRRSGSWYKKLLTINSPSGQRSFLYFEGANLITQVYVNGQLAGEHIGGYVGFEIEITNQLKSGENEILVRVDNGYLPELIPSQKSDFFIFGGITRDVWLKTVNSTFIKDLNVSTPVVSAANAEMLVNLEIDQFGGNKNLEAYIKLIDSKGKTILEKKTNQLKNGQMNLKFAVKKPELWHVDHPNLYRVEVSLYESGQKIDHVSDRIGFRWFEFKEHGPFYLNGQRLVLRGTHRHEEIAGLGAAMPNEMHRQDMAAIKEMGANFVRLGHYPQDPEIYRTCDELGILVWDELPWCRGGVGNEVWKSNAMRLLEEMIDQNFNHPSVIIWSLGNEIYWLPDFPKGDDTDEINLFLAQLNAKAHQLDPSRKTAVRKYYQGADIVDVFSPSIWSGWYSGTYKNYQSAVDKSIAQYPHFLHMEYGGSSHFGRHTENPVTGDGLVNPNEWEEPINQVELINIAQNGDWSENYVVDLFDWHLRISETHPLLTGNAQWAFRDFGTPLRPENDIPYVNQKGLMDRSGKPKDAYYVYKSYWSSEPTVYIESHTWTERSGPEKLAREISVFSNADSIEFFHNGKSLGFKKRDINIFPACGLNWSVNFQSGQNSLKAVGYFKGKQLQEDEMTVNYTFEKAGLPDEIVLTYETLENGHYLIYATTEDDQGRRCLDYEERVYFQCMSGGQLVDALGTPTGSSSIKMANGRAAIEVIPDVGASRLLMTVLNQDFKGSFLEINLSPKRP